MHLTVIIASAGRAELVRETVDLLRVQQRQPDRIIVVGSCEDDVAHVRHVEGLPLDVTITSKGLTLQRNAGLELCLGETELICFFDDDFLPAPDYLAELERLMLASPGVVGATGRLIADGIKSRGISLDDARALVAADVAPAQHREVRMRALYGCNFAFRASAIQDIRFDPLLPLYGWQEDVDFSYRVGRRGALVRSSRLAGVHMGAKGGRSSGIKLGYSQIANPIYLLRKHSIPRRLAVRLIISNVGSNLVRSFRPEPHVDRFGRLRGNLMAMGDLLAGRLTPMRVTSL